MSDEETIHKVLKVAKEAARLAGKNILQFSSADADAASSTIQIKSSSTDLVTETDRQCEAIITECIQREFPAHHIIGEESQMSTSSRYTLTNDPTWTIDPIDGTTNFVHQLQLSCVIISYIVKGIVRVGVIYDPYMDELFYAVKGQGAFCQTTTKTNNNDNNDIQTKRTTHTRPIHVSSTTSIRQAVISMDPGYGRDESSVERFCQLQKAILCQGVRNIRVIGATGLNMAKVASGRLDAGLEEGSWASGLGPKIWDFAAGKLLVEEAGGVTVDIEQQDDIDPDAALDLMKRSFFCASSKELAAELLQIIEQSRRRPK